MFHTMQFNLPFMHDTLLKCGLWNQCLWSSQQMLWKRTFIGLCLSWTAFAYQLRSYNFWLLEWFLQGWLNILLTNCVDTSVFCAPLSHRTWTTEFPTMVGKYSGGTAAMASTSSISSGLSVNCSQVLVEAGCGVQMAGWFERHRSNLPNDGT